MKILVVEDDRKTSAYLRTGLVENGFHVVMANDGRDGLTLATSTDYDAVVLDLMLPSLGGIELLTQMRRNGQQKPVLILTARDSVADRVAGLDGGADDYLVKPFAFSELLARIRSLLRRPPAIRPKTIQIADLVIDLNGFHVTRAGRNLHLTPKEFQLLYLLARHAGEIQTRTLIAEEVWNMNFDSDTNVVDVAISRLRRKVDEPFSSKLIHCVRGMGYLLAEE